MEDVLEVYHRPHDPEPVVCVDETSKQLISETRVPIKVKPGQPARHDYEYERNGTANLFMMFAPLEGWRHVAVTDRHTAVDFAHILKDLSDTHFPAAKRIVLMEDNLNTHKPASLYEAFPAAEARRLVERFEWHYTPKHGSWLNMAEAELSVLSGQCLDRRIPDTLNLIEEVAAWEDTRNRKHVRADWQFTTADARVKLKRLYPALSNNSGYRIINRDRDGLYADAARQGAPPGGARSLRYPLPPAEELAGNYRAAIWRARGTHPDICYREGRGSTRDASGSNQLSSSRSTFRDRGAGTAQGASHRRRLHRLAMFDKIRAL